jgi:hypothetical protein
MSMEPEKRREMEFLAGGSTAEVLGGAAAVVLAILGLAGMLPVYMAAVATIAVGAALFFEGGSMAAKCRRIISEAGGGRIEAAEIGGGMTAEITAGLAGVTLGVLALLGAVPMTLIAIAAIVFGGSLLISSGATSRMNEAAVSSGEGNETAKAVAREAVSASAGAQVLIGLGGAVLGILALLNLNPMVLTLVAMLIIGFSILLSGTAIGGRMLSSLYR